jgi:predicted short-subunit dehydrogenase-like oxidoreductase (DUF2520 family)
LNVKKPERIVIVGSGNVAEALCRAISAIGRGRLVQLFARNPERGQALAALAGCPWTSDPQALAEADLYLLAVSDRAIGELSRQLPFGDGIVAHTAGSVEIGELPPTLRRGVFYPLQTFTAGREVDFRAIPLFIEAENEGDYATLTALAEELSDSVYRADSLFRQKMHVGAVFVANFVNDLYAAGEQWMQACGMDFAVLKPLIAETTRKILAGGSPLEAQTGPAVRLDWPTIEKHRELLEEEPALKTIYDLLTEHIIEMNEAHGKF